MGGITHHANGRRQPFSDSTTRGFRGKTVALVDTGVVGARPVPFGRQDAVTAGERVLPAGDISVRTGTFDAVGDRIPVPLRATCPRPEENTPARAACPPPAGNAPGRGKDAMWTVRNGAARDSRVVRLT